MFGYQIVRDDESGYGERADRDFQREHNSRVSYRYEIDASPYDGNRVEQLMKILINGRIPPLRLLLPLPGGTG